MLPTILLGKTTQKLSRLRGNGGSALPGLIVERTNPDFIKKVLGQLKYGVVVISGTNGKTTTTKIVAELLEQQGLKVFTNSTGSNFVRGVISAILQKIKLSGKFDYDIAILELDEAHALKFAQIIPIKYSLLLNVLRDQLDRFGEIDHTAQLLSKLAAATQTTVVINREDRRLVGIKSSARLSYYGLAPSLRAQFPEDDELLNNTPSRASHIKLPKATVTLEKVDQQNATFNINGKKSTVKLSVKGIYNVFNATAAIALVKQILPKASDDKLLDSLGKIKSAFGRGESLTINGTTIEIFLVKNPAGFQLALKSFVDRKHDFMIAINDEFADGRDVSWLWNVNFTDLPQVQVVSGTRAVDMALRLKYDEVPFSTINENLDPAIKLFLKSSVRPKRIFTTYTAMLHIRKHLNKLTNLEQVL